MLIGQHGLRVGQTATMLLPPLRLGPCLVQRRFPVDRSQSIHVRRSLPQQVLADVGTIANHQDFSLRKPSGEHRHHLGGELALGTVFVFGRAPLLLVDPPQNRQAEVTVRAKRQFDDDAEHHPVVAEAEDLVLFRAQDRIEEDAAKGYLGSSFMGERVIDDCPDADARHQSQNS